MNIRVETDCGDNFICYFSSSCKHPCEENYVFKFEGQRNIDIKASVAKFTTAFYYMSVIPQNNCYMRLVATFGTN